MFDLKRHFNYSYQEQEEMLPFEREVVLGMIAELNRGRAPVEDWKRVSEAMRGVDVEKTMAKGRRA